MSRGNRKQQVFLDEDDRAFFLEVFSNTVIRFSWVCHAYCLMENHYHLLLETPELTLSEGMQVLNGSYSQRFNKKHALVGHVMQGRYLSPLVTNDSYLLELARYIVLNPVRSGLVKEPEQWRWSSYRATAGVSTSPSFLYTGFVLGLFSENLEAARRGYITFVAEGQVGPRAITSDGRVPLGFIFRSADDRPGRERAMFDAYFRHGYNMTEIADYLKVNCSTVSRALKTAGQIHTV